MRKKKVSALDLRMASGLNQTNFWGRFGVGQSGGSRYEGGRPMPLPLELLIQLFSTGKISEDDLGKARKTLGRK